MNYWLLKSEPSTYGIDHLKKDGTTAWTGVRNYQARNFMRDEMRAGDRAFFYHSSCEEPGIAGIAEVRGAAYPDETQFDRKSPQYDAGATRDEPRWFNVDVKFVKKTRTVTLPELSSAARAEEHADPEARQPPFHHAGDEGGVGLRHADAEEA